MNDRYLKQLGIFGYDEVEPVILAALVSEDPLLLIGRAGTGKTFLLNSLSEALELEHRHYNASLIAFDDLVGFPWPEPEGTGIRYIETPATVWKRNRCWWMKSTAANRSIKTGFSPSCRNAASKASSSIICATDGPP